MRRDRVCRRRLLSSLARAASRGAGGRIQVLFELGDQILEVGGLARELRGALALVGQRLLDLGLSLLPLFDQQRQALALVGEHEQVAARACRAPSAICLRSWTSSARSVASDSACWRISGSTAPSIMAERTDCSASSALISSAGGACAADALQCRQHLGNDGVRCSSDFRKPCSLLVERLEALLRLRDPFFDRSHARCGIDELLVELAPVIADQLDLALELGLVLQRPSLFGPQRLELFVAAP